MVYVKYLDHVLYNRSIAFAMKPQVREAVGWLVYHCEQYVTISWDRDAEPPTLQGGDPKASGLVLLKSDILDLKKLDLHLNSEGTILPSEYALQPTERKTLKRKGEPT